MNVADTIQLLELQKEDLLRKVASIDMTIDTLRQSMNYNQIPQKNGTVIKAAPEGYVAATTLKAKINFLLKTHQRFLHIREMADLAHSYDPTYSVSEWVHKFAPALSVLKRDGHVDNITIGKSLRNTFWGSPKWLDTNRQIIRGHEFNKNYLVEAGQKDDFKI